MNFLEEPIKSVSSTNFKVSHDIDSILFPVRQEVLYMNDVPTEYSAVVVEAIPNQDEIVYVSDSYKLIQNIDLMNFINDFMTKCNMEIHDIRNFNNRQFEINMINSHDNVLIYGEQYGNFRAKLINSYDGSKALQMWIGVYIQICSNGMIIGQADKFKHKHTAGLNEMLAEIDFSQYQNRLNLKNWVKSDNEYTKNLWNKITAGIPDDKNGTNQFKTLLMSKYMNEFAKYENQEFSLMMAVTDIATHGHKYGVSITNQRLMEQRNNLFLN